MGKELGWGAPRAAALLGVGVGELLTYKSQDTSCFLYRHMCMFVCERARECEGLHMCVTTKVLCRQETHFCVRSRADTWQGESMFFPDVCPASPQSAAGTWRWQLHDIPALACHLAKGIFLRSGPWFPGFPGGLMPVWSQSIASVSRRFV